MLAATGNVDEFGNPIDMTDAKLTANHIPAQVVTIAGALLLAMLLGNLFFGKRKH